MPIPDKAVEAVLRRDQSWPEEYDESQQVVIRAAARRDLEAAAPFIAAQALRDVIGKPGVRVRQNTDYGYVEETVYSRDMLASRANELDPS